MGKFVLKDASVTINSVDVSDHVSSVEISSAAEDVDITAMGASGRERAAGLLDESFTFNFLQDMAAADVDATLSPLLGAAAFPVVVKPTSGAVSSTNPTFTGSCILTEYQRLSGEVGAAATASVTLPVSGVITRATA